MIHLLGPAVLAAVLAGIGVYGILARRNAVLVLIGAELLLNAANVLLVTASALPAGGLAALADPTADQTQDPLISGQAMAIFVITVAAAEIGVALAVVLLLFRARATVELTAVQELGEAAPTHTTPTRTESTDTEPTDTEPTDTEPTDILRSGSVRAPGRVSRR